MNYNDCAIIADLLPLYIEGLTGDETNIYIADHLTSCGECRQLLEAGTANLTLPAVAPSEEKGEKTIKKLRFRTLWYLFWPLLYGLMMQFSNPETLRFFIAMLFVFGFAFFTSHNMEYNFDTDDTKKEFYRRENRNIREGKGTFFAQGIYWIMPILLPVVFMAVPAVIRFLSRR